MLNFQIRAEIGAGVCGDGGGRSDDQRSCRMHPRYQECQGGYVPVHGGLPGSDSQEVREARLNGAPRYGAVGCGAAFCFSMLGYDMFVSFFTHFLCQEQ